MLASSSKDYRLLIACIVYRTIIAISIASTFIPDEYYQSIEPALRVSHGLGCLTWEWKDAYMIRSYASILHYIFFFQICRFTGLDQHHFIISVGPRMIQAVFSGIADYCYFQIAFTFSNRNQSVAYCCLLVHLFSWSSIYMYSRTLINVVESNIFMYFLSSALSRTTLKTSDITLFNVKEINVFETVLIVFSCYIRSSSFLLYAPILLSISVLYLSQLQSVILPFHNIKLYQSITVIMLALGLLVFVDYSYYQKLTFPPYSFYHVNIVQNYASIFFGSKSWHWYFSSALPTVFGLYFPLVIILGWWLLFVSKRPVVENGFYSLLWLGIFVIVMLSVISKHKEIRFLLPVLPLFHLHIGRVVAEFCTENVTSENRSQRKRNRYFKYMVIVSTFTIHVIASWYLLLFHQVGTEGAFHYLSKIIATDLSSKDEFRIRPTTHIYISMNDSSTCNSTSIHLLAPCYTFPGYSYIINPRVNITLYSPDCFPRLNYTSESQQFRNSPSTFWMNKRTSINNSDGKVISASDMNNWNRPDYVVTLDVYVDRLRALLDQYNCVEIKKIQHAHFRYDYDDEDFPSYVIVYQCLLVSSCDRSTQVCYK